MRFWHCGCAATCNDPRGSHEPPRRLTTTALVWTGTIGVPLSIALAVWPAPPEAAPVDLIDRGRAWLAGTLSGDAEQTLGRDELYATLALVVTSPPEQDPHADLVRALRDAVAGGQNADGSWGPSPSGVEFARYGWVILEGSPHPGHRDAAQRARTFLEQRTRDAVAARLSADPPDPDLERATAFLRTVSPEPPRRVHGDATFVPPAHFALDCLAGGTLDTRRARAILQERFDDRGGQVTAGLGLPTHGGMPQDVNLAARVLAFYRSPRLTDAAGTNHAWPLVYLKTVRSCWQQTSGGFGPGPAGPATIAATSSAVLALDAVLPWLVAIPAADLEQAMRSEPRLYADLNTDCVACHERLQPGMVRQWRSSRHAALGIGCQSCHGSNHSRIFRENGAVSIRACANCHEREVRAFAASKHAHAEATLLGSALFAATPEEARASCLSCHAIGKRHLDGTTGSCFHCHTSHVMSSAAAREPEACTGCHVGEDYPQSLAYATSKHGLGYIRTDDAEVFPNCVTCHQPQGYHGTDFGITIGGAGSGGVLAGLEAPIPMEEVPAARFAEARAAMVSVCARCHSSRFSQVHLEAADELKNYGTAMIAKAAQIIRALHRDGLLGDGNLVLGGDQVRLDPALPGAEVLNRFYTMWRFHYAWTWKGAYHSSPSVSNLQSRPGLDADLEWIRSAAARLREEQR